VIAEAILSGASRQQIEEMYQDELAKFRERREKILIYE